MNKWLLEPAPPCILHGNSLPSITDIYMHKFNTFAHDIQVNHFSNSVTSMPCLTFYYRPSPLMIAPKLFPYKRVWIMVPYRKQSPLHDACWLLSPGSEVCSLPSALRHDIAHNDGQWQPFSSLLPRRACLLFCQEGKEN